MKYHEYWASFDAHPPILPQHVKPSLRRLFRVRGCRSGADAATELNVAKTQVYAMLKEMARYRTIFPHFIQEGTAYNHLSMPPDFFDEQEVRISDRSVFRAVQQVQPKGGTYRAWVDIGGNRTDVEWCNKQLFWQVIKKEPKMAWTFTVTKEEIQVLAQSEVGRELDEAELAEATKLIDNEFWLCELAWDVVIIAIKEAKSESR